MKRLILMLAVLAIATPAFAGNPIVKAAQVGDTNEVVITYDVNETPDGNLFRAFALTVSVSSGATVGTPYDFDPNYYIYPGSIAITGGDVSDYGTPIVAQTSDSFTIEMGSLYASNDPCGHTTAPPKTGVICKFRISNDTSCAVALVADGTRGGVIMEDTEGSFTVETIPGNVNLCEYPACWDDPSQCYGDIDDNQAVGLSDFYGFESSWAKNYPDPEYDPCADADRDGSVGLSDFYIFEENWASSVPSDCTPGDWNHVYCP